MKKSDVKAAAKARIRAGVKPALKKIRAWVLVALAWVYVAAKWVKAKVLEGWDWFLRAVA